MLFFCFSCRNFDTVDVGIASTNGFNDWCHVSRAIKSHELSSSHLNNYIKWKTAEQHFLQNKAIDQQLCVQFQKEKKRLRNVLKRLIAFVLYQAKQNIAFTGSSSNIYDPDGHNGNFQQLIHTCATFDPVLKEHLENHDKVHYMSSKTQNELIKIIGKKVQTQILDHVKQSKYYAIILDGTTDVAHIEQMCFFLRYVYLDKKNREWKINESFVKFTDISTAKTASSITEVATTELKLLELNLDDVRGQGFDNGAPMKGSKIGVQRRILNENPRAFFNPCGNHTLNLAVNDAAGASFVATSFFSTVQRIFVFLSASTNRWDLLKNHLTSVKALITKPLSTTRWSIRIHTMKPIHKHPGKIIAALKEIENSDCFKSEVRIEAGSISRKIYYVFICCACLWHEILSQTNIASKALQSIQSNLQAAVTCLESVMNFLPKYAEYGCEKVLREARDICEQLKLSSMIKSVLPSNQMSQMMMNFERRFFYQSLNLQLSLFLTVFKHFKNTTNYFHFCMILKTSKRTHKTEAC